jgi:hypothetical protein
MKEQTARQKKHRNQIRQNKHHIQMKEQTARQKTVQFDSALSSEKMLKQ